MLFKRMMKVWLSVAVVWCMSCINTSYSRFDEQEITGNELDLILGQFAHHGERFYENEVSRTRALLADDKGDFVVRNDLASAYVKLAEYEKAEAEFDKNEVLYPGKYETAANRGVLYKKMGNYGLAAEYLSESLEMKKGGHMGLGDYYLRMIRWLDVVEGDPGHGQNFLGLEYVVRSDGLTDHPLVNKEYLLTLIKNDSSFPDVYLVLGDVYLEEGEYQLAIRCYHRAIYLGHPMEGICAIRLLEVSNRLEASRLAGQVVESYRMGTHEKQVMGEIEAAREWLDLYQAIEATLIYEGKPVDFKRMKQELESLKISKPKVNEAMIYKGEEVDDDESALDSYVIDGGGVIVVVLVVLLAVGGLFLLVWLYRKYGRG